MARQVRATRDWFTDPGLRGPTRLTVTDEGMIFGHACTWATPHLLSGYFPPRSLDYSYFSRDRVTCTDGSTVRTGPVTIGTPHASLAWSSAGRVQAHYRDTGVAVADVACGPDQFGIWVAGAVRFGQHGIELIRGLHLSGDWRPVDGRPRLLALLAVDNPAFPIPAPLKEAAR